MAHKYLILLIIVIAGCNKTKDRVELIYSLEEEFILDTLLSDVRVPWGMDWLPDGRMVFTDRGTETESIKLFDLETRKLTILCNVPPVHRKGDGGMLDILVHPDYNSYPFIYYSYSTMKPDSSSTLKVERAKLEGQCLYDNKLLLEIFPYIKSNGHYGSRLKISNGYLFISMGERYEAKDSAQTLTNHFGKILRIHDDGRIPDDNPFVNKAEGLPEIWSYGHRNPQGMDLHPKTGELWINEHGPQGGDEINLIKKGLNYGWPIITYGEEYGGGPIGDGITEKEGMEQPVYYYSPSIAPSGMMFYTGNQFPSWKENIFIGSLAFRHINRLSMEGNRIVEEERLLEDKKWRVRVVKQGPNGNIYFGVDGGMILRIRPGK